MLLLVKASQVPPGSKGRYRLRELKVQRGQIPAKMFAQILHTPINQLLELHGWLGDEPTVPVQHVPPKGLFTDPKGLLQDILEWMQYLQVAYSGHQPDDFPGYQWLQQAPASTAKWDFLRQRYGPKVE